LRKFADNRLNDFFEPTRQNFRVPWMALKRGQPMNRPATLFADDSPFAIATEYELPKSAMRGVRALLPVAGTIAVLLIFDAAALGGRYRQAACQETQTKAQMFSYSINRMIGFAGPNR
jgi:hypothetical protein